jgi:hypothetical protein
MDIMAYIPKRRATAAAARPRDLTLPAGFIAPCLPMTAPCPPSGPLWLHEAKHDGFRVIVRKDGQRVMLYSRSGNDLTQRFPLIVETMLRLPSCTIDGEAIACDDSGLPSFDLLRGHLQDSRVVLYAFDLIELAAALHPSKAITQLAPVYGFISRTVRPASSPLQPLAKGSTRDWIAHLVHCHRASDASPVLAGGDKVKRLGRVIGRLR